MENEGLEAVQETVVEAEPVQQEEQTPETQEPEIDPALVQRHWAGVDRIYQAWTDQAEQLKQLFPDFDLRAEMKDPRFGRLLRSGVDVRTAHQAVHGDEILPAAMAYAARTVQARMADAMRAGLDRPGENGLHSGGAVMAGGTVAGMSRQDYARVCRMVERGERVSFG